MGTSRGKVENTIPVLSVVDLGESCRFYTEILGFEIDWGGESGSQIGSVSRDGHSIMLSQSAAVVPGVVWIVLEDESLFDEYQAKGVMVVQEPTNRPWAYEMKIADLDGNILWLGTEPRGD